VFVSPPGFLNRPTKQGRRIRSFDRDVQVVPNPGISSREYHRLVCIGSPAQVARRFLALSLDKDLHRLSNHFPVSTVRNRTLGLDDFVEPIDLDLFGDIVAEVPCLGVLSRRISKCEGPIILHFTKYIERPLMILCCLSRETGDNVGGKAHAGDERANLVDELEVLGTRIHPVHQSQNAIGA